MPKGHPLAKEDRERIYHMHTMNYRHDEIAKQFGITVNTVSKVVGRQRALEQEKREEKVSEIVIAGDKKNGRLVSVGTNKYEGTCLIRGKMKRCDFTASGSKAAKEQYDKWCQRMRDEDAFLRMVERKPVDAVAAVEEPVDTTPAPESEIVVHPSEIVVRPWKEVAEERQQQIERLERELEEARTQRVEFAEGYQMEQHNPAYLIWAKGPEPKCYGLYLTVETALAEVDRLNEVAAFLRSSNKFEVEEVAWK